MGPTHFLLHVHGDDFSVLDFDFSCIQIELNENFLLSNRNASHFEFFKPCVAKKGKAKYIQIEVQYIVMCGKVRSVCRSATCDHSAVTGCLDAILLVCPCTCLDGEHASNDALSESHPLCPKSLATFNFLNQLYQL